MKIVNRFWAVLILTVLLLIVVSTTLYGLGLIPPTPANYLPIVVRDGANSVPAPRLARGVNLGGDFEVDPRGEWGTAIEEQFFDLVAEAGFDHVRIPIRWSAYTGAAPAFTIDEAFFVEVDWLLEQAARVGLTIVIDTHHFEELDADPTGNRDELLAIWRQVGARYADQPATVVFELNNEPQGVFIDEPELWNDILADTLAVVRETNPTRLVLIGSVQFNHPNRLPELRLPADPNLMATVHVYDPTDFTAQGAPWFDPVPPTGVLWSDEQPTFDVAWENASWDSVVTLTDEGVNIAFERQYAAFGAIRNAGAIGPLDTLTLEIDEWFDAFILCNWGPDQVAVEFDTMTDVAGGGVEMMADISGCGSIERVAIQNGSPELSSPTIRRVDLCEAGAASLDACERVIVRSDEALDRVMRRSAEWATANNVEMYLGEFGVYDDPIVPVDRASRAAWIRALRVSAERYNINWAYFELSSEFGLYDHDAQSWHDDMLSALFD